MHADEALKKLMEGNKKYVQSIADGGDHESEVKNHDPSLTQKPFAVILGCSDSRVPAERVFNQGSGDLFVVRVAGNIAAPSQIGSVEFACQKFGTRLIVVLGHTHCGAIEATMGALLEEPAQLSPNLAAIVDHIAPAVQPVMTDQSIDKSDLSQQAMSANVQQSVRQLEQRSDIIRDLIKHDQLRIVGAEYSIESGAVQFNL